MSRQLFQRQTTRLLLLTGLTLATAGAAMAAPKTWVGGGTNGNWSTGANWDLSTAPAPGDSLAFAGTANLSNTNDFTAGTLFSGISFSSGAGSFALQGNALVLGGDVSDNAANNQEINLSLGLGSAGRTFNVAAGGRLEVGQAITGSAGVTKDGAGTLTLSARNTYGGQTVVSNGTVSLTTSAAPVPGMIYWLDAADLSTVVKGGDNKVSQWNDKSGNARHFSQSNTNLQPVYASGALSGKPGLHFDGADDQLVLGGSTTPRTVFIVNQVTTPASLKGVWGLPGGDKGIRMNSTTTWRTASDGNDFTYPAGSGFYVNGIATNTFPTGTAHIVSAVRGTNITFATSAVGGYFAGRYYAGDIAEVLAYDRTLSDAERRQVEAYLLGKWLGSAGGGLVSSPPVSGPVFWLDAANVGTIVKDSNNKVSRWNDAGAGGGPSYASQATTNLQPTFVPYALGGLPVIDFGVYYPDAAGNDTKGQWLNFDAEMTTVRTVFWVGHGANFILGDDNTYHFHRGGEAVTSPLWNAAYVSSNIRFGQTYLNGTNVNGTTVGLPDAFCRVSVLATNNCVARRLACDRSYRAGGQQVAEILLYDRALTDQERLDTETYLYNKWFGAGLGNDRLPPNTAVNLASGAAVLDLNGVSQTVGSLSGVAGSSVTLGLGLLTAGGDNTSTTFAGVISGSGAVAKEGTGTFMLTGANTYGGSTLINRGILKVGAGGALLNSAAITVGAGTVFDVSPLTSFTLNGGRRLSGSGSVTGLVAMAAGATLAPGNSRGTLTLRGGLTFQSNAVVEVEVDSTADQVRVSGGMFTGNTNAPARVDVVGAGGLGTFTIIDWTGSTPVSVATNSFVLGTVPAGYLGSLQVTGNTLRLTLVPSGPQLISTTNLASLRLAIADLGQRYLSDYGPKAPGFLARLSIIEANYLAGIPGTDPAYQVLKREALVLNNPALSFNRVMFVRRTTGTGLPANWQNVSSIGDTACNDSIAILDITNNAVSTLHTPAMSQFLGYPNVHWNGDRLLFTGQLLTNGTRPYTVFEMKTDGTGVRQVSPAAGSDIDWFDACYLPCGDMLMVSTATFAGVPCVTGADHVGNLYRVYTNGLVRQLTFDQDQNWGPTILADGRVMFTRWEYSDTPHYFSRILFTMMPDGLEQFARYGSGSFFPNCIFDAKPIPGKPSQFVGIISGHHGVAREGEMLLFDEAVGTYEANGVLHRFCGPNPVLPEVRDRYIDERNPWPRFVQPCPVDEKQHIVSARPGASSTFGLYLVDQFDNITTLYAESDNGLFHATSLKVVPAPPVIPDRVKLGSTNGIVNLSDLYFGPGLRDVPRGKVKNLRVYSVHYGYRGQGGHINTGIDGPWDVHRIIGTVPVYEDGSASFYAPVNTPISVQPLDEEGKALQVFRSWYTVMPGESVSCAGCHEERNVGMVNLASIASRKAPDNISPWYGPERGFSFLREVQPVLDKYCVGCHGGPGGVTNASPDLYNTNRIAPPTTGNTFPASYVSLHRYVRRTGNEGYFRMNNPGEWHADTSDLTQILQKGHYGVALDADAWSHLVTWMDLNVPAWGLWSEHQAIGGNPNYHLRRQQTMAAYASITNDPEIYPTPAPGRGTFVAPAAPPVITPVTPPADTLFDVYGAKARRDAATNATTPPELVLSLGNGINLVLDLVPAGRFLMGSAAGYRDEVPQTLVTNTRPFYIGKFEIQNKQYALFDPTHVSGFVPILGKDHCSEGWSCNDSNQPVLRVSWAEAMSYCEFLTKRLGRKFTLPTEAQWEYACRAGSASDMWYGPATLAWTNITQLLPGDSFYLAGAFANLAGLEYQNNPAPNQLFSGSTPPWYLCNTSIRDSWVATANGSVFASNPFGLCAMHGNAAEWTRSSYTAYPYADSDGRNRAVYATNEWMNLRKVVRGGSCVDREKRSTASFRSGMYAWQRGYNVGFRVVADISATNRGLPTASFTPSVTNGLVALSVSFDGSASRDDDGSLFKYDWDFGDGASASGSNRVTHTYLRPGSYAATLKVTDDDAYTATATQTITVRPRVSSSLVPVAQFTPSPATGAAPCRVTFDGSASHDADGTIAAWYWDFGDGLLGSGSTATHNYTQAGRYNVSLTVVDNTGLRDTSTGGIVVTGANGNQAPFVEAGPPAFATLATAFTLCGTVTDDSLPAPPGSCSVAWSKVKGPGTVSFGNPALTNSTVAFGTNGVYVLQLTANDGEVTASDTVTITVTAQGPYHSPQEVAFSPDGALLAVADVTAHEVALADPASAQVLRTVALAGEPHDLLWLGTNSLFASEYDAGTVVEINPQTGAILRRFSVGPKPSGLAFVPTRNLLLVTDSGLNRLQLIDRATGEIRVQVGVIREPHFVAVTPDQQFAIVANHLSLGDGRDPQLAAALSVVNLSDPSEVEQVVLPTGSSSVQRPVCSPDGRWVYVTHLMGRSHLPTTQLSRGWVTTSAVTIIDLQTKLVYATALFDQTVDGAANPWGPALTADGATLWTSLSGVRELGRLDLQDLHPLLAADVSVRTNLSYDLSILYRSNLVQRLPLSAEGPRGLAISPNQSCIAVAAYYAGQVLLLNSNGVVAAQFALGAQPAEDSVRRGDRLFNDANGCYQRWVSCITCHPGTRADGMNWDMMNDGFGNPKNTKSLLYAPRTEPAMWTGIRANAMVGVQAGYKFIEFQAHPQQDYDDIYNFLMSLEPEPSPYWVNGKLTPDAAQGKAIFESAETRCVECHRPNYYYADTNKFDVDTRHQFDWTQNDITGYVPPPLFELWRSAPYLHDGSALTMRDVLTTFNAADRHGRTSHLNPNQVEQLAAFLLQIGGDLPTAGTNAVRLDVVNGGGGGQYLPGSTITVSAWTNPPGLGFNGWTGQPVLEPTAPTTTLFMPDTDAWVTALFQDLPGLPDSDADGNPDSWTWRHFGHATGQPWDLSRAQDDADGDGHSNYQEYVAGTNPRDPGDYFRVVTPGDGGAPGVAFNALWTTGFGYGGLSRFYGLDSATNLVSPAWAAVPGFTNLLGAGQLVSLTNSVPLPQQFWRGRVWLAPAAP